MTPLSFTVILSGLVAMAAAYPSDENAALDALLQRMYAEGFGGSEVDEGMETALLQEMLAEANMEHGAPPEGDYYKGMETALLQEMFEEANIAELQECSDQHSVRLAGRSDTTGRLEICIDNVWKKVCDDGDFGDRDAQVVCKQLGFSPNGAKYVSSRFRNEDPSQPIWSKHARCTGNEPTMTTCPSEDLPSCDTDRAVAVECPSTEIDGCGLPPRISEMTIKRYSDTTIGSVATYSSICGSGSSADTTATCLPSGNWTTPRLSCKKCKKVGKCSSSSQCCKGYKCKKYWFSKKACFWSPFGEE